MSFRLTEPASTQELHGDVLQPGCGGDMSSPTGQPNSRIEAHYSRPPANPAVSACRPDRRTSIPISARRSSSSSGDRMFALGNTEHLRRLLRRLRLLQDTADHHLACVGGRLGVTMEVHRGAPSEVLESEQPLCLRGAPDEQPPGKAHLASPCQRDLQGVTLHDRRVSQIMTGHTTTSGAPT